MLLVISRIVQRFHVDLEKRRLLISVLSCACMYVCIRVCFEEKYKAEADRNRECQKEQQKLQDCYNCNIENDENDEKTIAATSTTEEAAGPNETKR